MKNVTLNNGMEVRGEVVEEDEETLTLRMDSGTLILDKADILSKTDFFDCTLVPKGQFIDTPRGVYLKIDTHMFVRVSGPAESPTYVERIFDGTNITHEEVFPEMAQK